MSAHPDAVLTERLAAECYGSADAHRGDGDALLPIGHRTEGRGTTAIRDRGVTTAPMGIAQKPELYELLADHEAGRLPLAEVRLGELPANATADMRRVADDMRTLMGLRLAAGEDRPLPYATTWAAERLGWGSNHRRASRAIHGLCDAGVVCFAGSLPGRGKRGTKTYAPPLAVTAAGVDAVEGEAVGVEPVSAFEPVHEVGEQGGVKRAALGERLDGLVASRDGASGRHDTDDNADGGVHDAVVRRAERIAARHGGAGS